MVRLFVSTSHICTLYMISYARSTAKLGYKDILILDTPAKKSALKKVITDTQKIYPWNDIIDLSATIPDNADFEPNVRKSLTRRLKGRPVIKPVYDFLLKLYLKRQSNIEAKIVRNKLLDKGEIIEINVLTQTMVNTTLFKLYSKASVNYFEHGQGDYFFIQNVKSNNFNFYCVFADSFRKYLQSKKQENNYVKNLPDINDFPTLAKEVIDIDTNKEIIKKQLCVDGKLALILMENVQIYNVSDDFWKDYLDLCISQVNNPSEYTFILKPHPLQSFKSMKISKEYMLTTRRLKVVLVENDYASNYSVEVLYCLWKDNTTHVFCLFSSGLFYIANLYKNENTKYFYAYNFFKKYIDNAPAQYSSFFLGLGNLMEEVFSPNCIEIRRD